MGLLKVKFIFQFQAIFMPITLLCLVNTTIKIDKHNRLKVKSQAEKHEFEDVQVIQSCDSPLGPTVCMSLLISVKSIETFVLKKTLLS